MASKQSKLCRVTVLLTKEELERIKNMASAVPLSRWFKLMALSGKLKGYETEPAQSGNGASDANENLHGDRDVRVSERRAGVRGNSTIKRLEERVRNTTRDLERDFDRVAFGQHRPLDHVQEDVPAPRELTYVTHSKPEKKVKALTPSRAHKGKHCPHNFNFGACPQGCQ